MTTAREIMHEGAECIGENETLREAARKMKSLDVGALPICSEENRLLGMLTDRDIVVKCVADGGNPDETKAGELKQGNAVTIGADDEAGEVLRTMSEHKVRRLPVIDGHKLVGMVALADVSNAVADPQLGMVLDAITD